MGAPWGQWDIYKASLSKTILNALMFIFFWVVVAVKKALQL